MYLMIEDIEGPWAVIEWGKDSFKIPKLLLPGSAQKGDEICIEVFLNRDSSRLRRNSSARHFVAEEVFDDLD